MEIRWPWVSRHRLEQIEKQLESVDSERRELLDRLLGGGQEARLLRAEVQRVTGYEDAEEKLPPEPIESQEPLQFTTPFDRIGQRFDQARKSGALDPKYKARA